MVGRVAEPVRKDRKSQDILRGHRAGRTSAWPSFLRKSVDRYWDRPRPRRPSSYRRATAACAMSSRRERALGDGGKDRSTVARRRMQFVTAAARAVLVPKRPTHTRCAATHKYARSFQPQQLHAHVASHTLQRGIVPPLFSHLPCCSIIYIHKQRLQIRVSQVRVF